MAHLSLPAPWRSARPLDGNFGITPGQHAEGNGADEGAQNGAQRHEGEEHQHAAMAFKIRGFKDFHPGQAGADAERGAAQNAKQQTQQNQQRDLHLSLDAISLKVVLRWVAGAREEVHGPDKKW